MENKPFLDVLMLVVSLLGTILFCRFLFRHPHFTGRKAALFAMVFFAMNPFLNLWAHEFAIGISAFVRWQQGLFVYDFRFYSLMLLGAVFIGLGGYLLAQLGALSRGVATARRSIRRACLLQMGCSLPLFPLNPIGLMPALASLGVLAVLFFASRRAGKSKSIPVAA
ncbi:MAG: hypothetical protein ICV83_26020 [Cytophagales bacterium]|nr:hypothetical protein [Cytophagales bacterium]